MKTIVNTLCVTSRTVRVPIQKIDLHYIPTAKLSYYYEAHKEERSKCILRQIIIL